MQYGRNAPKHRCNAKRTLGPQPVDEGPRDKLTNAIGQQEAAGNETVVGIANTKFTAHDRCHNAKDRTIDVVDSGDDRQQNRDTPAHCHDHPLLLNLLILLSAISRSGCPFPRTALPLPLHPH